MIEAIGYLGSILVVVSMLMSSVVRLRIINTTGSAIFAFYALLIRSYPTALMNLFLVGINIYNLVKLSRKEQNYDLVDGRIDDNLLHYMLEHYREDIRKYFPHFSESAVGEGRAYIVCCQGNLVGVLLGAEQGNGVLDVELDYSIPAYRDCSIGTYLYGKLPEKGIRTLVCRADGSQAHAGYLTKMGFVQENGVYVKKLG